MGRGLLAVGVVVVIVVAIVLMNGKPAATTNPELPSGKPVEQTTVGQTAGGQNATVAAPIKLTLECETPTTIADKADDGTVVLQVVTQNEGKPITFLKMPEDWIKSCGLDKDKGTDAPTLKAGRATYDFDMTRDDTVYVDLRAKWADECGDSVFVKIDDGTWFVIEDSNGKKGDKNYIWEWHQLLLGGKPKGFDLKKGKHTLYMATREDGPCLDKWLITTEASKPIERAVNASMP